MRNTPVALAVLAALALAGCNACPTEDVVPLSAAPATMAAAAPCAPAAQPFSVSGPSGAFQMGAPVGVRYTTGPNEHIRAGLTLPANVLSCFTDGAAKSLVLLGDTLRCATANLWPTPQPAMSYVYSQPAPRAFAAPCLPAEPPPMPAPAAAPCAPK